MTPYDYAWSFVSALAGDPNTAVLDWRALHDTDKGLQGHVQRGTLPQVWEWLCQMNSQGYGIFCTVAAMNGQGRTLDHVSYIRAHYVDLDEGAIEANYSRAAASQPAPSFAVVSSPGKFHVYWTVQPYNDNERFTVMQRKLRQVYDGDVRVVDAARVMRVPGTYHLKNPSAPHLVTCHALPGFGQPLTVEQLEAAYASVNVIEGGGGRHDLGDTALAAPSLDWLRYGLSLIDPNHLDRGEWIAITAAVKQSGWTLADEATLRQIWEEWCARYNPGTIGADGQPLTNNPAENQKQWNSIRNTELGWRSLVTRVPALRAATMFGADGAQQQPQQPGAVPMPDTPAGEIDPDSLSWFLDQYEQQVWFKGCSFITNMGKILTPEGRFLNSGQFNGHYGGKVFVINSEGKTTDEPWRAATRSTLWQIPKVDHVRFLPHEPHGAIVSDALGRKGVNIYKPAVVHRLAGDPTPFLNHLTAMIPDENDRAIIIEYLAHNFKFPGYKIPWAPVIQSAEGIGKGVVKKLIRHAMGGPYIHWPNAKELTDSGSQFNGWLRYKLFILADEIKVDDKRDLVEVLKPLISESEIEVQSKGVDQEMEDNYANWMFFTNYKDAVPISKNGRRYCIFYSPIQTEADLLARGMNDTYFNALFAWLDAGGAAVVTNWLCEHPVERGKIVMRAPKTTSWDEAVRVSRTPVERVIMEAIEVQKQGFRGGWVSVQSAIKHVKEQGATRGSVAPHVITGILESLGYVASGRAPRPYFGETNGDNVLSDLFHIGQAGDVQQFGRMQGWE